MANIIISRTANLDRPGNTEFLSGTLFADENLAHTFAISATRNGAEIALSGVVTACFIRPDGGTVELNGTIEDGKACVTLDESCYVVTGRFKLTIFVSVDGAKTAVYCAAGNVVETTTNTIIDPGSVVPSVNDIIAEYGTMQQAVEDCNTAKNNANSAATAANIAAVNISGAIAYPYVAQSAYPVGSYCTRSAKLYRCITAIPTGGETWTESHWTEVRAMDEVVDIADDIEDNVSEITGALSDKLQEVVDNQIVETTEAAAFAYIPDAAKAAAKSVDITITPVQNLNGYDHPWPAGGGKNKLPLTVDAIKAANTSGGTWSGNRFTTNGIAYSLNIDANGNLQGITINGTATANSFFYLAKDCLFPDGTYILNGCPSSGNADTYSQYVYTNTAYFDTGNGVIVPVSSQTINVIIRVMNGVTASNVAFKPMIRLSSETDATFTPYSNTCPISGRTSVKVGRTGKNMLPKMVAGTYTERGVTVTVDANGVATLSGTAASTGNGPIVPLAEEFVIPKAGLIYCLNNSAATAGITPTIERASGGGAALTWSTTPANRQITLDADKVGVSCARIRFYVTNGTVASGTYAPAIMAEADDYVPNDGENSLQTITLPEEAGTVYGGTLHINEDGSGVLTVTHGVIASYDGETLPGEWISDRDVYAEGTSPSSGAEVVYALGTSTTYTFTAEQVRLLKGTNVIYADAGDTAVEYVADTKAYIDNKIAELQALILENI